MKTEEENKAKSFFEKLNDGKSLISKYCEGEKCRCGEKATQKIEQVIFDDMPISHGYTQYVCQKHFEEVMMPYKHSQQTNEVSDKDEETLDKEEDFLQLEEWDAGSRTFFEDIIADKDEKIKRLREIIDAAYAVLSCVPIDNGNVYLSGFDACLKDYQKLTAKAALKQ
jgi:hypothetical protein